MKYLSFFVLGMLIVGSVFVVAKRKGESFPLIGKVIVVDAGHGGKDPGTSYKDIYEKDINLEIALFLERELVRRGAIVIMTRSGDYDLSSPKVAYRKKSDFDNRIRLINDSGADSYVSLHINYLEDTRYKGIQVFYLDDDRMAKEMQEYLNAELGSDREAKRMENSLYMYEKLDVPGVLVECGFLSNASEREKLVDSEYQKTIASAIADSLVAFY